MIDLGDYLLVVPLGVVGQRLALEQHEAQLVLVGPVVLVEEGDAHRKVPHGRGEVGRGHVLLPRLKVPPCEEPDLGPVVGDSGAPAPVDDVDSDAEGGVVPPTLACRTGGGT